LEKVLIIDTDKCTGCKICELVCSMAKLGEFNPKKSYIRVLRNKDMDINLVALGTSCDFCGECLRWCAPGAIKFVDFDEAILKWKGVKVGSLPAPLISNL
jgi:carbon-monoxide dehydrogenase iron sulfur subunit